MAQNVEDALTSVGVSYRLRRDRFRFYLQADNPAVTDVLRRIFGIQTFSPIRQRAWSSMKDILDAGEELFSPTVRDKKFAVRARRGGQVTQIPFRSIDVERELGTRLLPYSGGVDLSNPQTTVSMEIHPGEVFFFDEKIPAPAGLPIGAEGRALALVSGGFDSAVASWLMLKRGVSLDYLFCNLGGAEHRDGVRRVMKVIADQWSYGYRPRLYEIDFSPVVQELKEQCTPRYWQIILKRQMLRAAARLGSYLRVSGIVTGEAVGQVSSQTLQNLAVISRATELPLFRPLLGFNKDEIISLARDIGTFAFSAGVAEYCAILPRHPATHATWNTILDEESGLDPGLIPGLVEARTVTNLRAWTLPVKNSELEITEMIPGATVLDLRSSLAYSAWHYPTALNLDFFQALRNYRSLDSTRTYVLYCEVGQKSAHLAELMTEAGFTAYHFKSGIRQLLSAAPEMDVLGLLPIE